MTTFLLHGGATSAENPIHDDFFRQFTELVDKPEVRVLLCLWSREREEWDAIAERDSAKISNTTDKRVLFHVVADSADLLAKIADYDVLYVVGGEAELLEPYYKDLSALKHKLDGKIYAGSSMGAFLAAEDYVLSWDSQAAQEVHKGVGLLPIQVLCHWNSENQKEEKLQLLTAHSKKPIIVLNEGEFVIMYRN